MKKGIGTMMLGAALGMAAGIAAGVAGTKIDTRSLKKNTDKAAKAIENVVSDVSSPFRQK